MFRFKSKIFLRTDYVRHDGLALVCIRARINGTPIVENHNIYLHPLNFDQRAQTVIYSPNSPLKKNQLKEISDLLDAKCARIYQIRTRFEQQNRLLTPALFRQEFQQAAMTGDFYDFMRNEIKLLKFDREPGTIRIYEKVLNKLIKFRSTVSFGEIDLLFIQEFENYLLKEELDVNSRWSVHKVVKKFINCAIDKHINLENPYKKFKSFSAETDIQFLETNELMTMLTTYHKNELDAPLQHVLRYYLFSCTGGGLRISDAKRLDHTSIQNDDLVFFMYKNRRKKKKKIIVPLSQHARSLINTGYGPLFKTYSDQVTNRYLKEIARIVGINKELTFHTARHTFATQFLIAGGKVEVLQKILGHSKIDTTMRYVHITNQSKKEQMHAYDQALTRELIRINQEATLN